MAFEQVERYAREIVPSFSASAYFGIGTRVSKWVSQALYDVRLAGVDEDRLAAIDKDATVVFVMNHRSNMDYLLVTWLVAERSALSYAVGEWARNLAPVHADPVDGRLFHPPPVAQSALSESAVALCPDGDGGAASPRRYFPRAGFPWTAGSPGPKLGFLSYIVTGFDPDARGRGLRAGRPEL